MGLRKNAFKRQRRDPLKVCLILSFDPADIDAFLKGIVTLSLASSGSRSLIAMLSPAA